MTNGTASSLVATATAATTGNDTSHTATIVAGVEVGIKLFTSSSGTPVKTSWGFEAD